MNKKMNIRALIFRVADAALRMGGGGTAVPPRAFLVEAGTTRE